MEWSSESQLPFDWFSKVELQAIHECRALLATEQDTLIHRLEFLPEYGSIVLVLAPNEMVSKLSIVVLGLGPYQKYNEESTLYNHVGRSKCYKELPVGAILKTELDEVMKRFTSYLNREKRPQKKSPTLVRNHMERALSSNCTAVDGKQGGSCGNSWEHTEGKMENTSFSLVSALVEFRLTQACDGRTNSRSLFQRLATYCDLRITDEFVGHHSCSETKAIIGDGISSMFSEHYPIRMNLDNAHAVLVAASFKFWELDEKRHSLAGLLEYARGIKARISTRFQMIQESEAEALTATPTDLAAELSQPGAFRNPLLNISKNPPKCSKESLDSIRVRAQKNIGMVPVLDMGSLSIPDLHVWCCGSRELSPFSRLEDAWLVMR